MTHTYKTAEYEIHALPYFPEDGGTLQYTGTITIGGKSTDTSILGSSLSEAHKNIKKRIDYTIEVMATMDPNEPSLYEAIFGDQ